MAGWCSASAPAAPNVALAPLPRVAATGAPLPSEPAAPATGARGGGRRITPAIHLTPDQEDFLTHDPVTWSKQAVDATRAGKRADCKRKLPKASDEYCERILQVDGRVGIKFIDVEQRFLRGEIDQDTYQAEVHRSFLEHSIALEQFMPARDFSDHEGMPPGGDPFMAVMGGFAQLPPGYKMGDEIFDPSLNPFAPPPAHGARVGEAGAP
jgi:hypothetical protein